MILPSQVKITKFLLVLKWKYIFHLLLIPKKFFVDLNPKYITSINFSYFNNDNIDSFSYLFKDFERLISFDINAFKAMTSMEGIFQNC